MILEFGTWQIADNVRTYGLYFIDSPYLCIGNIIYPNECLLLIVTAFCQVHHPIDYARVVKQIGNEMDLTKVQLEGILPSATIMVVSVTATTTSGRVLSSENLVKTIEACDMALQLDSDKLVVGILQSENLLKPKHLLNLLVPHGNALGLKYLRA